MAPAVQAMFVVLTLWLRSPLSLALAVLHQRGGGVSEEGSPFMERWFRGRLVFKAQRRLYHSTVGLRVKNKEEREEVVNTRRFPIHDWSCTLPPETQPALEATQGQIDGFFSQLPYKCHQNRVTSVGD